MCFGDSSSGRHSSHARPVELQPRIPIRQVVPLEGLEYDATPLRQGDNPFYDTGTGHLIDFFAIRHRDRPNGDAYIAILAAYPARGALYGYIYPFISSRYAGMMLTSCQPMKTTGPALLDHQPYPIQLIMIHEEDNTPHGTMKHPAHTSER